MSTSARAFLPILVTLLALRVCANSAPASTLPPNLATLSVKQLRAEIASRGLTCTSCTEKLHLVEFLQEHIGVSPRAADARASSTASVAADQSHTNHHQPTHPTRDELLQQLRNQQPGFGAPKDESPAEAIMRRMQAQMDANNGFFDASKLDLSGIKAEIKAKPKARQPKGEL